MGWFKLSRARSKNNNSNKKKKEDKLNVDIIGIIYIATGILLGIAIYTSLAGVLSSLSQNIAYAIIGVGE